MGNLYHHSANERGAALITMMLISFLIVGLVLMSLTNSMVGKSLTSTHLIRTVNTQCAEGNLDMGEAIFLSVVANNMTGLEKTVNQRKDGGDPLVNDFLEEIDLVAGTGEAAGVTLSTSTANIVINDPSNNCTTSVDVDFIYSMTSRAVAGASAPGAVSGHHRSIAGRACADGDLYDINTTTTGTSTGQSVMRSVYYKCPNI